ncbi:hypothetical protein ACL02T_27445 [Pseudonocardia sp. RS010]|uniref:hypothetical protein n=1 Tax=Pseudonocardia sp. RS010 TaxID=3385979 RepID=UPI0039A16255
MSTETLIGTGINVFTSDVPTVGKIRFLDSPEEVLDFIDGPDVAETIVFSRGGTTTFMSPARMAGVAGLITLQGAPESHLGVHADLITAIEAPGTVVDGQGAQIPSRRVEGNTPTVHDTEPPRHTALRKVATPHLRGRPGVHAQPRREGAGARGAVRRLPGADRGPQGRAAGRRRLHACWTGLRITPLAEPDRLHTNQFHAFKRLRVRVEQA